MKPTSIFPCTVLFLSLMFTSGCDAPAPQPSASSIDEANTTAGTSGDKSERQNQLRLFRQTLMQTQASKAEFRGWNIVESQLFGVRMGLPKNVALKNPVIHLNADSPNFTFEMAVRNNNYTAAQIADATEKDICGSSKTLISEELNLGPNVFCRIYAHEDSVMQLGRIYITDENVWVITASFKSKNRNDERIKYFFSHFELLSSSNPSNSDDLP